MGFPIVIWKTGKEIIPDVPVVIIIAQNGRFMLKRMGIVEAAIPYSEPISGLAIYTQWAELNVDKIPFETFMQIFHFMRTIYKDKKTECNVILFYNPTEKRWSPVVPNQTVTHSSVHYEDGLAGGKDGRLKVGTFHSHCDFGAFHSGGDDRDEEHFDGIHITMGHVDKDTPTLSVSLVVNGIRFIKAPQEYIDGVRREEKTELVQEYETKWVDDDEPDEKADEDSGKGDWSLRASMANLVTMWLPKFDGGEVYGAKSGYIHSQKTTSFIRHRPMKSIRVPTKKVEQTISNLVFDFPEGKNVEDYPFPEEWLTAVKTYQETRPTVTSHQPRRKRKYRLSADKLQAEHGQQAEVETSDSNTEPCTDEEGRTFEYMTDVELDEIIARHQKGCQEGDE